MPGFIGRELCPDLIIVPCNFKKYRTESAKVMQVIAEYDPNYSAMSLDEAYVDLTDHLQKRSEMSDAERTYPKQFGSTEDQLKETVVFGQDADGSVQEIRHRIYLATNLTASAGTSCFLPESQNVDFGTVM